LAQVTLMRVGIHTFSSDLAVHQRQGKKGEHGS
jgi:hypothetical protein